MDPIFLNLGIQQQPTSVGSSAVSIVPGSSPTMNQINGIPQESKLATYISNRQQLSLQSALSSTSAAQNHLSHQLHSSSQANHLGLGQSGLQTQNITKCLATLGLDPVTTRKPPLSNLGDFNNASVADTSSSLSHSASTPSFQSFGTAPSASMVSVSSSLSFPTTTTSSPIRVHSPTAQPSPIRGVSAPPSGQKNSDNEEPQNSSALSTYHENVGGTTYFFTAQDMSNYASPNASQDTAGTPVVYPPYHVAPPTPAHVHHMRTPTNAPHFFMGDELRHELLEKQALALAQVDPDHFQDLPQEVDMYHELIPLEPRNSIHKSSMFGYATSVYKATNVKTGLHYALYRIHGYRLSNVKVTQIVDVWKTLQHSSLIQLREVFTTKEFNDNSIVFVYDFHPGSETLAAKHFSPVGVSSSGWERLTASLAAGNGSTNTGFSSTGNNHEAANRNGVSRGMLPENTLWTYIIQLTGAVRAIHTQGLACRTLDASKILLTDNKSRIRINCCGVLDILNFDPNAANPLAGVHTYQQEDLVNLGKLIVSLACSSYLALQRDNISAAIDLINRHYSRDLATLVVCLLTSQRVKSINDVMPIIGARFYAALESSTQRGDIYEAELGKEIHNGRLYRLLTKLDAIVDRPQLNHDNCWSETGDRYMLKLFREYIFHQQTDEGQPWLDLGHITTILNKLDSGSPDKVCLMSHNEQNVLVASYAELKKCFDRSFQEIIQASAPQKNSLS